MTATPNTPDRLSKASWNTLERLSKHRDRDRDRDRDTDPRGGELERGRPKRGFEQKGAVDKPCEATSAGTTATARAKELNDILLKKIGRSA